MSIKLYSPSGQGRTQKILVAAKLANLQLEFVETEVNEKNFQVIQNQFPFGKFPVLETQEGNLFESNAILRYIARNSQDLYGKTLYQQGLVDQWLDVTSNELETDVVEAAIQILGLIPVIPPKYKTSLIKINHTLTIVNTQLGKSKYISGDSLTVADIALAQVITFAYTLLFGESQRNKYQNLKKWLNEINSLPEWRSEFGRPRFPNAAFVLDQLIEEKKMQKEKEKQPFQQIKQEAPKKQESNSLDLLPPSNFNLDKYKRMFFKEKNIKKNIETLFATIDLNGWSLWLIKYNNAKNEGTQLNLSKDLIKKLINIKLDQNFRKYAFAINGVYGDEPNLEIRGAWIWRGTDIPKEWRNHVAYEFYEFIKIEVNDGAQKQLFIEYWIKQEINFSEVEGLKVRNLIYFK